MISTTVKYVSIDFIWTTFLSLLVNPFGWKRHASLHLTAVRTSPIIPLFGRWYLDAESEEVSADILLEIDRLGRRRCRIVNLNGLTRHDVRKFRGYVTATRWTASGDDEIVRKLRA